MGSRDFSDGAWIWPEGLHHYVEIHSVRLPAEFINHIQSRDFQVPSDLAEIDPRDANSDAEYRAGRDLYERLETEEWQLLQPLTPGLSQASRDT